MSKTKREIYSSNVGAAPDCCAKDGAKVLSFGPGTHRADVPSSGTLATTDNRFVALVPNRSEEKPSSTSH